MSSISIKNLNITFRIYKNKSESVKDYILGFVKNNKELKYIEFDALKNISIDIKKGERLGIVGHNGAGKSTLLKTLCKIYEPSSGEVIVDGKISALLEIGAGFNVEMSGRENIYLNSSILGYDASKIKQIENEIIDFTGLSQFIDSPVKYYSTGMYLRLAFAIATAVKPDILILDELFAGGDADFIDKALKRMHNFIQDSSIMVFVSHQHDLLLQLCNRIIWIDHGQIIADGNPQEVINQYLKKDHGKI